MIAYKLGAIGGAALGFLAESNERSGGHIYHEVAIFVLFKLSENWAFFESFCKIRPFGVTNKLTQKAENSHLFNERENERKSKNWE